MNKKILHICESSFFLKTTIENFEKCFPGGNMFLVNTDVAGHDNYDYSKYPNVICISYNNENYNLHLDDCESQYFLVIFHSIGGKYKYDLAKKFEGKIPMHGILFGHEIYQTEILKLTILLKHTRKYVKSTIKNNKSSLVLKTKRLIYPFVRPNSTWNRNWRVFNRLTSYSTILKEEKYFIKSYYRNKKIYFPFNYSGIYSIKKLDLTRSGKSILIGNSATPSNNHLDVLEYIDKNRLDAITKIVLPLSYGDKEYANKVEKEYKDAFGERVVSLRKFIPIEEYSNLISSCSFVIMNHIRQQAMGNIFLSLLQGAKVFLNKKSFAYKDLIEHGIRVYKLRDFKKEYPHLEDRDVIESNRQIIHRLRGPEATKGNILKIVNYYNN